MGLAIVKNCRGRFVVLQVGNGQVIGSLTSAAQKRMGTSQMFARSSNEGMAHVRDSKNVRSFASVKAAREAYEEFGMTAMRDADYDAERGTCQR